MHFDELLPETIFETIEEQGFIPTGVLFPLNSYENRVYEIKLEEQDPLIAKYYRPGRWSKEALNDEHRFLHTLGEAEIPVVEALPLKKPLAGTRTLAQKDNLYYAFYPKFRGRQHDEITDEDRQWLGRLLARLHNVSSTFQAKHRLRLTPETYGYQSLNFILSQPFLPPDLKQGIETLLKQAIQFTEKFLTPDLQAFPVHGDCHPGNILWNKDGPHLVDFDDMVIAPPVQDIWMLFDGTPEEKRQQQNIFFEGYETFRRFDKNTLILTEPLRTLRMIRYAAWIGQRYTEPAFQKAFPYYTERRYWEQFLQSIREQIALLQEI